VEVERAIVFAERDGFRALELDLYHPSAPTKDLRPLVHFIHGGGWRTSHRSRAPRETREWERGFFERITDAGFVVAASEYRFSGEALFPAPLEDSVDALRWLHTQSAQLGVDADRIYQWGASAGGNLAALAGLVPEAPVVAGVVCWYPITNLLALDQRATDTFEALLVGGPIGEHLELARAASPVCHVRSDAPPFLIQHGDADTWVSVQQAVDLAEALTAVGASVRLELVPGADHFFGGAPDVEAIFERALGFLAELDSRRAAQQPS